MYIKSDIINLDYLLTPDSMAQSITFNMRMSKDFKELLQLLAHEKGLSVSTYVKMLLIKTIKEDLEEENLTDYQNGAEIIKAFCEAKKEEKENKLKKLKSLFEIL